MLATGDLDNLVLKRGSVGPGVAQMNDVTNQQLGGLRLARRALSAEIIESIGNIAHKLQNEGKQKQQRNISFYCVHIQAAMET